MLLLLPSDLFQLILNELTIRDLASICCTSMQLCNRVQWTLWRLHVDLSMVTADVLRSIESNLRQEGDAETSIEYSRNCSKCKIVSRFPNPYKVVSYVTLSEIFEHGKSTKNIIQNTSYFHSTLDLLKCIKGNCIREREAMCLFLFPWSIRHRHIVTD